MIRRVLLAMFLMGCCCGAFAAGLGFGMGLAQMRGGGSAVPANVLYQDGTTDALYQDGGTEYLTQD